MIQFCVRSASSGITRYGTASDDNEQRSELRRIVRAMVRADTTSRPGFREMIDTIKWSDVR